MNELSNRADRVTTHLHPAVYRGILVLALLLIVGAWGFVVQGAYAAVAMTVVSGFVLLSVLIPWRLRRMAQEHEGANLRRGKAWSFSRWLAADFETWQYRLSGRDAAITVLLPFAAAAIGMIGLMVEYRLAAS